ncbi:MAG: hypothetical protein IPK81_21525 [Rhodospirillales bacterium]|nr:MAG: hypothetical protein IPK81_21525 [Rhodospirillales bacterium]
MTVTIKLDDYLCAVEKRKAELGLTSADFLPNSGERRTPAKRAALEAVERLMRAKGKAPPLRSTR